MGDDNNIDINKVKGDILGASISGTNNTVTKEELHAQTIIQSQNIILPAGTDLNNLLKQINSISTEVKPGEAAGLNSNKIPQDISALTQKVEKLGEIFEKNNNAGKKVDEIATTNEYVSRKDLEIKKAILIKTEADQIWYDHVNKRRTELGRIENDLNELLQGFNYLDYQRKLNDAYSILENVNKEDPTDTEVLLNMAKILMVLTYYDPTDEEKLLYRILNLLGEPKNESEKFRLAQTNIFLSVTRKPYNVEGIKNARKMFEQLGRSDWVTYADILLNDGINVPANNDNHGNNSNQPAFQAEGKWHVDVGDLMRSTMTIDLNSNGSFIANQQSYGWTYTGSGMWKFDLYTKSLYIQGVINGVQPFMMQIMVHNIFPGGFEGIGMDGFSYRFTKQV